MTTHAAAPSASAPAIASASLKGTACTCATVAAGMPAPHAPGSGPTLTIVVSAWPW